MKKMMMALAALCVAGAASAVDITWTHTAVGTPGSTLGEGDGVTPVSAWTGSTGGTMSYALRFTVAAMPQQETVVFQIDNSATADNTFNNQPIVVPTNSNGIKVIMDTTGALRVEISNSKDGWTPSSKVDANSASLASGTEYVLGFTIDNSGGMKTGNVSVYLGNTLICTSPTGEGGAYHFWKTELDQLVCGADGVTTDVTLYYAEGIATADQIAALPEPTALALLALGVAGLALRRKAA